MLVPSSCPQNDNRFFSELTITGARRIWFTLRLLVVRDLLCCLVSISGLWRQLQHREVVHGVRLGVASVDEVDLNSAHVVPLGEELRHGWQLHYHVLVCAVEPHCPSVLWVSCRDPLGWWTSRAPTLCCTWVASSRHAHSTTWNCGVGNVHADSNDMSAPLEWADWSAQSHWIIFSAMISSKLLMENALLAVISTKFRPEQHIISSNMEMTFEQSTLLRLRAKGIHFRLDAECLSVLPNRGSSFIARLACSGTPMNVHHRWTRQVRTEELHRSVIIQQLGRLLDGQEFLGPSVLTLVGSELSASETEVNLTSKSLALARVSIVTARDSSASLNLLFMHAFHLVFGVALSGHFGIDLCRQAGNLLSLSSLQWTTHRYAQQFVGCVLSSALIARVDFVSFSFFQRWLAVVYPSTEHAGIFELLRFLISGLCSPGAFPWTPQTIFGNLDDVELCERFLVLSLLLDLGHFPITRSSSSVQATYVGTVFFKFPSSDARAPPSTTSQQRQCRSFPSLCRWRNTSQRVLLQFFTSTSPPFCAAADAFHRRDGCRHRSLLFFSVSWPLSLYVLNLGSGPAVYLQTLCA